jgi:hypothetical protein
MFTSITNYKERREIMKAKSTLQRICFGAVIALLAVVVGCATNGGSNQMTGYEKMLKEKDNEIEQLRTQNQEQKSKIDLYDKELAMSNRKAAEGPDSNLFPPDAQPGECWARVFIPPTYQTKSKQVLVRGNSERLEVIPAKYNWVNEKVLVKEASERMEIVPAEYKWVEETVLIQPSSKNLVEVPAKYDWQEEKVLVKEAHTMWKKGRGPIEKVDNTTGEIMCLVEVPAVYKTVKRKVMVNAPATKEVDIPAEYKTIKKRVMVKPPRERKIQIPAEYATVKVRKVVTPAQEKRIKIPAEYQTVARTEIASDGHMAWRRILCETNVSPEIISQVQHQLRSKGFNPGDIDGVYGRHTESAIKSYQRKNELAVGGLTHETLKHMGISL